MQFKRMSFRYKNSKVKYYSLGYIRQVLPVSIYQSKLNKKLAAIKQCDQEQIWKRLGYYNKLNNDVQLSEKAIKLSDLNKRKRKTYYFDLYEYARYFKQNLKGFFLFGDITNVPEEPACVKSRPIGDGNENSIILKWNKVRHFIFVKDKKSFQDKKDLLVSRGKVHVSQPHRGRFLEKYFEHPLCHVGMVNKNGPNINWLVNRMTIREQLEYKFILCLEGNDVASNLKWVMSSNSLAVMPKPNYETWFMEGTLKPDFHFVQIKDDYSDLEDKLNYYLKHTDKAEEIIRNANEHVKQFKDKKKEDLISLLVLQKYFEKTGQLNE